ncbi:MAG: hypothetical protein JSS02_34045 [Planctomycetes bacterium]|nr:hypothetical protein [Planctomycetota bacterium]
MAKSVAHQPADLAHAINLSVLALAHNRLEHLDDAWQPLKLAEQAIQNLHVDPGKRDHDLLIAQILFREAEALISGPKSR